MQALLINYYELNWLISWLHAGQTKQTAKLRV